MTTNDQPPARSLAFLSAILFISILFITLRQNGIGHLLVWDEAMQLNTIRSLIAGEQDYFSGWFWRHPPLLSLLMMLMQPQSNGFAERTQCLILAISLANLAILGQMSRRSHGEQAAVLSCLCLATMPGAVFFDVWIKADSAVAMFGLLAITAASTSRPLVCGISLAVGFLFKETIVFYAPACLVIALHQHGSLRVASRRAAGIALPVAAAAFAWYAFVVIHRSDTRYLGLGHLKFAISPNSGWGAPWHYYLTQLRLLLDLPGIILLAVGLLDLCAMARNQQNNASSALPHSIWPVLVLAPSLIFLSLLPNKVPWIVISLLPPIAMLQGAGAWALLRTIKTVVRLWAPPRMANLAGSAALAAAFLGIVGVLLPPAIAATDHESFLRRIAPGQWVGSLLSRNNARAVSAVVNDTDRLLLTSFHYWQGIGPAEPCAIFTYYMTKKPLVLIEDHNAPFDRLAEKVVRYRIDWALLSPDPGEKEYELFDGFVHELGCTYFRLHNAFLFQVPDQNAGTGTSRFEYHSPELLK